MLNKIDLFSAVEPIIRQAGTLLLSYYHKPLTRTQKQAGGFVTEADIATEAFLIKELKRVLPEASIFAEESADKSDGSENKGYCWVIDPLDGTTNFAHEIPYFCISVALTYNAQPVFGIIYAPVTDDLYYAKKGKGSYLNGKPLQVSELTELSKSFLLIGVPYKKSEHFLHVLSHMHTITPRTYAFRHMGAIALDLAYVASAKAEAVFFEQLEWWDIAAGILLIEEAGGVCTTYQGTEPTIGYKTFVAGNKMLHGQLLKLLKKNEN